MKNSGCSGDHRENTLWETSAANVLQRPVPVIIIVITERLAACLQKIQINMTFNYDGECGLKHP